MKSRKGTPTDTGKLRPEAIVSILALAMLLVLSLVYYKARMLFIDAPHNLFLIINDGHFHIEERRTGSFISQLLPFAGSLLHLPYKVILLLYSAGFNLFYLAAGLLLVRYRSYRLLILFALYLTLFTSDSFYWPNNEVHQGMGWLMIAYGVTWHVAQRKWHVFIALPLFVLFFYMAMWTHPLTMLVCVFLWFFFWAGNVHWPFSRVMSMLYTAILLLMAFLKFNFGVHHGYDSSKMEAATNLRLSTLASILHAPEVHAFGRACVTNYWIFILLFATGMGAMLVQRRWLLTAYTLCATAGFLLLVWITFPDGQSKPFYIQCEYMPLIIIGCVPFVYFVLPLLKGRTGAALLAFIFCVRICYILASAQPFVQRIAILEQISGKMEARHITKAVITGLPHEVDSALIMSWGAPVESISLSRMKHEFPQRTFIFLSTDETKNFHTEARDTLMGCWEKRPSARFNPYYFNLDTTTVYQVIDYHALMHQS